MRVVYYNKQMCNEPMRTPVITMVTMAVVVSPKALPVLLYNAPAEAVGVTDGVVVSGVGVVGKGSSVVGRGSSVVSKGSEVVGGGANTHGQVLFVGPSLLGAL